jgi:hypothetical protein
MNLPIARNHIQETHAPKVIRLKAATMAEMANHEVIVHKTSVKFLGWVSITHHHEKRL